MALVVLALGCMSLGAYLGRGLTAVAGIAFFVAGFACVFALNVAAWLGHHRLTAILLLGVGVLMGLGLGSVVNDRTGWIGIWPAAGTTGGFLVVLGTVGYVIRRDLSSWAHVLFWALVALLLVWAATLLIAIPHVNLLWSIGGLVIFGGYTMFDFNRLRRAQLEDAVLMAASIFLDILNVFLFFLQTFRTGSTYAGRTRERVRIDEETSSGADANRRRCAHYARRPRRRTSAGT